MSANIIPQITFTPAMIFSTIRAFLEWDSIRPTCDILRYKIRAAAPIIIGTGSLKFFNVALISQIYILMAEIRPLRSSAAS